MEQDTADSGTGTKGLHTTGEVMKQSGLSRQVLYQYTAMGLIAEAETTRAGYRLYPESVFRDLRVIRALNQVGYSLRDIKEIFFKAERVRREGWIYGLA